MRQIKFQCLIIGNDGKVQSVFSEWLDGDGWKHDYYAPLVTNGVFSHEELGDGFLGKIVRRQFTGLTDKNGTDIYQGDKNQDGGICVWIEDSASFCWDYPGIELMPMENESEWCEVVSNIHENIQIKKSNCKDPMFEILGCNMPKGSCDDCKNIHENK